MASLAFGTETRLLAPVAVQARPAPNAVPGDPVSIDNLELIVISVMAEATDLKAGDRAELAARVLARERTRTAGARLAANLPEIR